MVLKETTCQRRVSVQKILEIFPKLEIFKNLKSSEIFIFDSSLVSVLFVFLLLAFDIKI